MTDREISILVQNTEEFENSELKNNFIKSSDTEWIGFIDGSVTDREELCCLLEENPFLMDYDAILFGDNVPEGECDCFGLLAYPETTVYALFFRKKLLVDTGSYNRFLLGNGNYEFCLRLAEKGKVFAIPCSADKATEFHPVTMAYIIRRYMESLKQRETLNEFFLGMVGAAECAGKVAEFNGAMNTFLSDIREYEMLAADTAPCLILVSDDTAKYGIVDGFANSLADELVGLGQAVITTNDRYGNYSTLAKELLLTQSYKAVIGFQSPALQSESFRNIKGVRYQFWLDDPMFSAEFFTKTPKQTRILCQDANYAEFLRRHFDIDAKQFPPGGVNPENKCSDKIYDVVFIGTYISLPEVKCDDDFRQKFYEYMLQHVDATVEQGIRSIWQEHGIPYDENVFMETIEELQDVCYNLLQVYRHKVVEAILDAGIKLHVFGDSWKKYQGSGRENLVIHPKLMTEEALQVWSQAKIGLNIMNGHKAGMTERIANIMLCGACCVSDETSYLKEHFCDGEEIVCFRADKLEQLIERLRYLLANDAERERIALKGREKALCEHTWRKRAEELLVSIENETKEQKGNATIFG